MCTIVQCGPAGFHIINIIVIVIVIFNVVVVIVVVVVVVVIFFIVSFSFNIVTLKMFY